MAKGTEPLTEATQQSKSAPKAISKPSSKAPSKTPSKPTSTAAKRPASPERPSSPAPKRTRRTEVAEPENDAPDTRKSRSTAPKTRSTEPKSTDRKPPSAKPTSAKPKSTTRKTLGRTQSKTIKAPRIDTLPTVSEAPDEVKKKVKGKAKEKEPEPPFIPIPAAAEHHRPAALLFAWGCGNMGQLGMGPDRLDIFDKPTRNKVIEEKIAEGEFGEEGAGIESIECGGLHTLFIDEKGKVWSCGVNDDAALGQETTAISKETGLPIDDDQTLSVPRPIQTLVDEKFRAVKVAAGDSISAAISDNGELKVWGSFRGREGRLGFSGDKKQQLRPVSVLDSSQNPRRKEKVADVAAGDNHLLALTTQGMLYSWGAGEQGELGRKILERRKISGTVPDKVVLGKPKNKAVAIGAGANTSYAVDEDGVLWAWGHNNWGQTGTGSEESIVPVPTRVVGMSSSELPGGAKVVAMAGGLHHSAFLTSDGKVYACGRADSGQMGLPKDDRVFLERGEHRNHLRVPELVPFSDKDDPVARISCGVHCTAAVTKGGALLTWGQGVQGELGLKEERVWVPTVVVRKEGGKWRALSVSCGGQHTLGLFASKE